MRVLIDVAPDELPEQFQRLVDSSQPLKHPARFAPGPRDGGFMAWVVAILCVVGIGLFGFAVLKQVLPMSAGESYSTPNLALGLLFIAPLTWWLARQVRLIRLGRVQAQAMADGRYRRGVYFESSGVLSFDGERCTFIPKGKVVRIDRRAADHVESGAHARGTYIVFKGPGGAERSCHVAGLNWEIKATKWLKSGALPSE